MKLTINFNEQDVELINGVVDELDEKRIEYDGLQDVTEKGKWGMISLTKGQITIDLEHVFLSDVADICKTFAHHIRKAYDALLPKFKSFMSKYEDSVENIHTEMIEKGCIYALASSRHPGGIEFYQTEDAAANSIAGYIRFGTLNTIDSVINIQTGENITESVFKLAILKLNADN